MKALTLALALLAAQVSPVPSSHFSYTDESVGLYNMAEPLLAEGVTP